MVNGDSSSEKGPPTEQAGRGRFSYDDWYEENKTEFNKDRRSRYENDPEYRAKVLEWNRESRKRKREERLAERKAEAAAAKIKVTGSAYKASAVALPDGSKVAAYSIGALASALKRSIQVLRLWEAEGVIPKTPHQNAKGDRLYTFAQIKEIYETLKANGRLRDQGRRQKQRFRAALYTVKGKDGTETKQVFYRVGVLATVLERTIVTVEQLETREVLPATPFRGGSKGAGYRLYTMAMIRAVRDAFSVAEDLRSEEERARFREAVRAAWESQGVWNMTLGSPCGSVLSSEEE